MEGMSGCVKKSQEETKLYNILINNKTRCLCGTLWNCLIMADGGLRLRQ
jgi:hypothetical protein